MTDILCVLRSGGAYDPDYVFKLRDGVTKHLENPAVHCLNDLDTERFTHDGIDWIPLEHDWPRHWAKVEMWRPDLEDLGHLFYIDLDTVVTGRLDDLASYDGDRCIVRDFYYGTPSQSVLSYAPGSMRVVWDEFTKDPAHWMSMAGKQAPDFHDQTLMNHIEIGYFDYFQDLWPDQVVSYKVHAREKLPEGARLVCFHGVPKPHEALGWVKEVW